VPGRGYYGIGGHLRQNGHRPAVTLPALRSTSRVGDGFFGTHARSSGRTGAVVLGLGDASDAMGVLPCSCSRDAHSKVNVALRI
jgi:hypothetical protein